MKSSLVSSSKESMFSFKNPAMLSRSWKSGVVSAVRVLVGSLLG